MRARVTSSAGEPHVVVADGARQMQAAELVRDARQQVIRLDLLLAQRHLVSHELLADGIDPRAQLLQKPLLLEKPATQLLECAAHPAELRTGLARSVERAPELLLVRHELGRRLAERASVRDEKLSSSSRLVRFLELFGRCARAAPRCREPPRGFSRPMPAMVTLHAVMTWRSLSSCSRACASAASASTSSLSASSTTSRVSDRTRAAPPLSKRASSIARPRVALSSDAIASSRRTTASKLTLGLLQILFGRHQPELAFVGHVPRLVEGRTRSRELARE